MHGAEFTLRLNSAVTIKEPSILSISIFWSPETSFQVSGCPIISQLLANKNQWFVPPSSMDPLAEFKQVFAKVIDDYQLNSSQIKMGLEANYTGAGQPHFTPLVIELLNFVQPSAVILPTGTLECRQFANYWIDQNDYPRLSMGEKFEVVQDHYDFSKLTSDEKEAIDRLIKSECMQLTFSPPPAFLTVSKELCVAAVRILKTNSMAEVRQQLGDTCLQIDSVLTLGNTSEETSPQAVSPVSPSSVVSQPVTPLSPMVVEPTKPVVTNASSQHTPPPSHAISSHHPSSKVFPVIEESHEDLDLRYLSTASQGGNVDDTVPLQTQPTSFLYRLFRRPCCTGNVTDILSQSAQYKDNSSVVLSRTSGV